MQTHLQSSPLEFAEKLRTSGRNRLWIRADRESARPQASSPEFVELADFLSRDHRDFKSHEAIFLEVGAKSGALFGVFIHDLTRGQSQGGVRRSEYASLEDFLRDGLRLSLGMGRKCALADLWWGGGKAIIAAPALDMGGSEADRNLVYEEFGRFVTSLRGCYVTAEDAGTSPADMAVIHGHTRFATCIPHAVGGSGNPACMTASGVVRAMESALAFRGLGGLEGRKIAMQGAGSVGTEMVDQLFEKGAARVVVTDLSRERCENLQDRFPSDFLRAWESQPGDDSILEEPADILCPNALGGVIGPKNIPSIRARIVCGAANNPLLDDARDAHMLAERGISYVPDYVANRMGIVACSNEHAGNLPMDPFVVRHLEGPDGWEHSIYNLTTRILARAQRESFSTIEAAEKLADDRLRVPHPIWGDRGRRILDSLLATRWERGRVA
jgi:glutamate dehydrogenase/leucine dehydrogenase